MERAVVFRHESRARALPARCPSSAGALLRFLRGGDDVTGATLSRFYALHVAILPAMTTLLVGLHLLFVQRQGMSVPIKLRAAR